MIGRILTVLALPAVLATATTGCGEADAQARIVLTRDDLPPSAGLDATGDAWQSVGWQASGDAWQSYPGDTTVVIPHDLGRVPTGVWVYVSFADSGARPGLATGDMAIVVEATDTEVAVANTTEADLFCRVVLR